MNQNSPIGVFDSGLGGLTVVRQIQDQLPHEDIVYFGDLARLPYGIKSKRQITICSRENTEFLMQFRIKALVIACNSSASAAYDDLRKRFPIPVLDVIRPAAKEAVRISKNRSIGILGTKATIGSGAYQREIKKMDPRVYVLSQACPLFVSLVEEGILNHPITDQVVKRYLAPIKKGKVDTLILGCTHFPLLKNAIRKFVGSKVCLVDCAPAVVGDLSRLLDDKEIRNRKSGRGRLQVYVSDLPQSFLKVGERFLGQALNHVKQAHLKEEITVKGKWTL